MIRNATTKRYARFLSRSVVLSGTKIGMRASVIWWTSWATKIKTKVETIRFKISFPGIRTKTSENIRWFKLHQYFLRKWKFRFSLLHIWISSPISNQTKILENQRILYNKQNNFFDHLPKKDYLYNKRTPGVNPTKFHFFSFSNFCC